MSVRRLLVLLLLVGSLLAVPVPARTRTLPTPESRRATAEFVRVTNAARRAHGLRPMVVSTTLTKLARSHPGAMAGTSARRFGRRCDGRALWYNDISRRAGRWVWLGQNVGWHLGRDGIEASVRRIQNAFMASPGHRRNILYRRATTFGVSTWIAGRVIWVTVNFKQTPPG
jgi:uncharacterized protein YkwD